MADEPSEIVEEIWCELRALRASLDRSESTVAELDDSPSPIDDRPEPALLFALDLLGREVRALRLLLNAAR